MTDLRWYLLENAQTESPAMNRERSHVADDRSDGRLPGRRNRQAFARMQWQRMFGWVRQALSMPAMHWPIFAFMVFLVGSMPGPALKAAEPESALNLGRQTCAPYGAYCGAFWTSGLKQGMPLNALISNVCLAVYSNEREFAGIDCLDRAVQVAISMPKIALAKAMQAPSSDSTWGTAYAAWLEGISMYCDQVTPNIHDYFGCFQMELLSPEVGLNRVAMN